MAQLCLLLLASMPLMGAVPVLQQVCKDAEPVRIQCSTTSQDLSGELNEPISSKK